MKRFLCLILLGLVLTAAKGDEWATTAPRKSTEPYPTATETPVTSKAPTTPPSNAQTADDAVVTDDERIRAMRILTENREAMTSLIRVAKLLQAQKEAE
jgi:hypothetical protein